MPARRTVIQFSLVWVAAALAFGQTTATIQITGDVQQPLTLSATDLAQMPRASVKVPGDAQDTVYEGVWLHEVLRRAGVPLGDELRGKALASYVSARAQDGYQVIFSLAELDPSFTDQPVLLVDTVNGRPMSDAQGRFRLVVPKDKPGARWVRMLVAIEVVQLKK